MVAHAAAGEEAVTFRALRDHSRRPPRAALLDARARNARALVHRDKFRSFEYNDFAISVHSAIGKIMQRDGGIPTPEMREEIRSRMIPLMRLVVDFERDPEKKKTPSSLHSSPAQAIRVMRSVLKNMKTAIHQDDTTTNPHCMCWMAPNCLHTIKCK